MGSNHPLRSQIIVFWVDNIVDGDPNFTNNSSQFGNSKILKYLIIKIMVERANFGSINLDDNTTFVNFRNFT